MQGQNRAIPPLLSHGNGLTGSEEKSVTYATPVGEGRASKKEDLAKKLEKEKEEKHTERNTYEDGDSSIKNKRVYATDEDGYVEAGSSEARSISTDQATSHSDNLSTTPLKSITSLSTKAPSVLSNNHDSTSNVASTAETSIAPSTHTNLANNAGLTPNIQLSGQGYDRDSESIVTLASSSRRARRRSLDTTSSTTGIPPASIMERLSVHPNAAGSTYSPSVSHFNSNERSSLYNGATATSQSSFIDGNEG